MTAQIQHGTVLTGSLGGTSAQRSARENAPKAVSLDNQLRVCKATCGRVHFGGIARRRAHSDGRDDG